MKELFYVRTAMLTLFEAYPDDPETGWMAGRECLGSTNLDYRGKYPSISCLLGSISPEDDYYPISKWEVSNIDDGGFLLNLDVLVDHNKRAPSPDRLKAWKDGHAHLCHGYYSIEVKAQRIEDIPADEIKKIIHFAGDAPDLGTAGRARKPDRSVDYAHSMDDLTPPMGGFHD